MKSLVVSGYALLAVVALSTLVRTGALLAGRSAAMQGHGARDGR